MDLYPYAQAIYALFTIATLASLKNSMKQIRIDEEKQKSDKKANTIEKYKTSSSKQSQKSPMCQIFKYLIQNYSFIAIFKCKIGQKILQLLLTYSLVGFYNYFTTFWYPSLGFGMIISTIAMICEYLQQMYFSVEKQKVQMSKKWKLKRIIYMIIGLITISFYLTMIGLCFKNYINSRLKYMLSDFFIAFAIDNFGLKPLVFLALSLAISQNVIVLKIVTREYELRKINKIANEAQPQTRHHFVINNLQIEPQPIQQIKSKQLVKSRIINQINLSQVPQPLPSSSIIDTSDANHEGSIENMISRVESHKTGLNKMTSMKQLNEIDLDKIQQNPMQDLQHYFCINLRRQRDQDQETKELQKKIEINTQGNPNIQTSQLVKEFILEDFICNSPKNQQPIEVIQQEVKSKCSKSKGSLRGIRTFRILQKQNQPQFDEKDLTCGDSTKHEISINGSQPYHKESFSSHRRPDQKTHILKISETGKSSGELQEIDINSPNKKIVNTYETHPIPEEDVKQKVKRRRRTIKQVSQPYLLQEKLIQVYFPGKNKSDLDNFIRSKKKNFDRSQFFNHSNKKQHSKGRQKPIVHENEDQQAQFFIPKF